VEQAAERERWSATQWRTWQQEQLAAVLHRAATRVPYYREQWAQRRRCGDSASFEYLENWPILEKGELKKDARAFVADDCDTRRMFHEHTSGTSGKPLDLWWSRDVVRSWYALFEARCRGWYGVSRHTRWAILGGQLVAPSEQRKPPFWVWNGPMNQLYMSSYHLAPDLTAYYLDALAEYKIQYLWGYTSALSALAQDAIRIGRKGVVLRVVITNAEPVYDHQRRTIEEAFQCPVRETYGMAEIVTAATECPEGGRLHTWPEVGWTEVLNGSDPVASGATGDLVCTGLMNRDMPLIRYRVGDRAAMATDVEPCACGRSMPLMQTVEGRVDDVLYSIDGRRIGRLDPVFKSALPIHEAQIIQESLNRIKVRYVPSADFRSEDGVSIVERITDRMGPIAIELEAVARIPRESNGKFRAVVCKVPPEEIAAAGVVGTEHRA
jgi:phenylacetate-CoA ligase